MTVTMDFNRTTAENMVSMALNVPVTKTKKMSDKELIEKAFYYGPRIYGFENMQIIKE